MPAAQKSSRKIVQMTMNTPENGSIIDATVPIPAFLT